MNIKLIAILICSVIVLSVISVLNNNKLAQPSVVKQRQSPVFLSLQSPSDNQIITGKKFIVKGKTLPKSTVVIFTENNVNSIESDSNGNFRESIELSSGLNKLTVSAFTPNGEEKKVALDIVYDDSDKVKGDKESKDEDHGKADEAPGQVKKQEEAPQQSQSSQQSQSPQEQPKQEQPPAQENKAEQQASSGQTSQEPGPKQKATVGNVERVTTSSIVVEEKKFKQQIETKVDKNTIIKNQDNKVLELRKIKPRDEAAIITEERSTGGNITATPEDNDLHGKAARIYVNQATSSAQSKRHAVQGIITNVAGNNISIVHLQQTNRNFTFSVSDETVVKVKHIANATIKYLKAGQLIVAVGDLNDGNVLLAKWIHVIKDVDSSSPTTSPEISSVPISTVPSSVILPSNAVTPTYISSMTPSLIPSPTPVPCSLTSASWNTPSNPVSDGTSVGLKVEATGECAGKQVNFEIFESDSITEGGISDVVDVQPASVTFLGSLIPVEGIWTAKWQSDCLGLCNPPEYYFKTTLVGGNTIQSDLPLLSVEQESSPTPSPTPTPTPSSGVLSARSQTIYGTDGTKCFDSDGNNQLNERYYVPGYCQDNTGVYYDYCPNTWNRLSVGEYYCAKNDTSINTSTVKCQGLTLSCSNCGQCSDGAYRDSSINPESITLTPTPFAISTPPLDITPPVITRISPLPESTVSGIVNIEVVATDNVGVEKIDFYIASYHNVNIYLGTVRTAPYKIAWDTTKFINNWSHLIFATAYDAQGNSAEKYWAAVVSNP